MRYILLLIGLLINISYSKSAPFDFYENRIFDESIKTVTLFPNGYPFATPIIQLNTRDQLVLGFDELGNDVSDFKYTIVQCDHDWNATNTTVFDYIDGFSDGYVSDYDFSFNTTVSYIHYQMTLPNEDFQFKQSGNYVLVIFRENMDEPVLTHRFMVSESKVVIENAGVLLTRNADLRDKFQEITFELNHEGFNLVNPFQDINVTITQNDRWDNSINNIKPLFINENRLLFNYNMKIAFPSMKEYRELDIRTMRYRTERVRAIDVRDSSNIVYMMPDAPRQLEDYRYEGNGDLNGKFIIDRQEGRHGNLEADYAEVHFYLTFGNKIGNGTFYVVGQFNSYDISDANKMEYNEDLGEYESTITLKQGFYNYFYVFVPDDNKEIKDHSFTEGNYYDTENDYGIYIYYRPFGQRYDQLIGYSFINSRLNRH